MSKTVLSVNLNKIALLRNSRGRDFPSVVEFGRRALDAGAGGLTIHPRPDQRHARYSDIEALKSLIAEFPGAELNIEGKPVPELMAIVYELKPNQFTLVPDGDDQITSDHGYDLPRQNDEIVDILKQLSDCGIRSSVFMDPDPNMIPLAGDIGADRIELYTEQYAVEHESAGVLSQYAESSRAAVAAGLGVNAGHDLDLANLGDFLNAVPDVLEVSIGHALTVEALSQGWDNVVAQYVKICNGQ